ncbi:MAG: hypothetical protein NZ556_07850 [Fimbriimonadales bacterium]|nr:hypothetical protein [Fimbriimonadales bacterium]
MSWLLFTTLLLSLAILDTVKRWFTLPKRYNSLGDIARDPLGAIANAAQWAIPLGAGLPGGIQSLPKLLTQPQLLGQWSLGNISLGSLVGKGFDWKKLGTKDALLAIGGLQLLQGQRRADAAARALSQQGDIYRQLFELNRPVYEQLMGLRSSALAGVPSQAEYEAQAKRALDEALEALERSEQARGVRTLSAERRRAEAANRYAVALANYPMERLRLLFGLPAGQALQPLQLQSGILGQQYADANTQLAGLAQALAFLIPTIYGGRQA